MSDYYIKDVFFLRTNILYFSIDIVPRGNHSRVLGHDLKNLHNFVENVGNLKDNLENIKENLQNLKNIKENQENLKIL